MKKRNFKLGLLTLIFSFFLISVSQGQSGKIKKKELKDIQLLIDAEQYNLAQLQISSLLKRDSNNIEANFLMGLALLNDPLKKASCERFLVKALKSEENKPAYYLGMYLRSAERFEEADRYFMIARNKKVTEITLVDIEIQHTRLQNAKEIYDSPKDYDVENLGKLVNSDKNERYPWISYDQSTLYFISDKDVSGNIKGGKVYFTEMEEESWKSSVKVNQQKENDHHIEVLQWASLGKAFVEDLSEKAKIKKEEKSADDLKWIKYSNEVNIPVGYLEASACVNKENTIMFFAAKRNDGLGGKDIFLVKKLPTGIWATPQNLGNMVNSKFNEESPYFHESSRSLYFSSEGHETVGGFDIFKVKLDENFLPMEREHFGYPLNSAANEMDLSVNNSEEIGYFISDRPGGMGGYDLYAAWISIEPRLPAVIKGIITDGSSQDPLNATITLIEAETQEVHGIFSTRENTGACIILLERGKTYDYFIEADGYMTNEGKLTEALNNISDNGEWIITLKKEE